MLVRHGMRRAQPQTLRDHALSFLSCSGRSTKLIHGGIRYLEAAFMKADTEMYEMVQVRHKSVCLELGILLVAIVKCTAVLCRCEGHTVVLCRLYRRSLRARATHFPSCSLQEALSERAHLLNAAPFMTHALPIIIPLYTWWEIPYMWAGELRRQA